MTAKQKHSSPSVDSRPTETRTHLLTTSLTGHGLTSAQPKGPRSPQSPKSLKGPKVETKTVAGIAGDPSPSPRPDREPAGAKLDACQCLPPQQQLVNYYVLGSRMKDVGFAWDVNRRVGGRKRD